MILPYYRCPTHAVQWSADYLAENGKLHNRFRCQKEKCVLERAVTDPTDTFDLGATK